MPDCFQPVRPPRYRSSFQRIPVLAWILVFPISHAAVAEDGAAQWRSVMRIEGRLSIEDTGWIREQDDQMEEREVVEVHFTMVADRESADAPQIDWHAESATVVGSYRISATNVVYGSSTTTADFGGSADSLNDFRMTLDLESGAWQIVSPGHVKENYTRVTSTCCHIAYTGTDVTERNIITSGLFQGTVSSEPGRRLPASRSTIL